MLRWQGSRHDGEAPGSAFPVAAASFFGGAWLLLLGVAAFLGGQPFDRDQAEGPVTLTSEQADCADSRADRGERVVEASTAGRSARPASARGPREDGARCDSLAADGANSGERPSP